MWLKKRNRNNKQINRRGIGRSASKEKRKRDKNRTGEREERIRRNNANDDKQSTNTASLFF
jgi:hypothetical protein